MNAVVESSFYRVLTAIIGYILFVFAVTCSDVKGLHLQDGKNGAAYSMLSIGARMAFLRFLISDLSWCILCILISNLDVASISKDVTFV